MTDRREQGASQGPRLPIPKQPFLPNERFGIRRIGRPEYCGLTVYVFYDVAEEILYTSRYRTAQITAGLLTGGYYKGPAGPYVEVRGFRESTVLESTLDFAQQLKRTWTRLHQDPSLVETGQLPIGWFLSKPGCQAKPGPFEWIVHLSYFNLPYHLFLLLDPLEQLAGLYCQSGDTRILNVGFNLIEPARNQQEQSHENRQSESS